MTEANSLTTFSTAKAACKAEKVKDQMLEMSREPLMTLYPLAWEGHTQVMQINSPPREREVWA